jgi:transposase-like protein
MACFQSRIGIVHFFAIWSKTRRSFPTDESVMKVLYLALHQIAKKWTMPIRDWKQAMTQFMLLFGERLGQ